MIMIQSIKTHEPSNLLRVTRLVSWCGPWAVRAGGHLGRTKPPQLTATTVVKVRVRCLFPTDPGEQALLCSSPEVCSKHSQATCKTTVLHIMCKPCTKTGWCSIIWTWSVNLPIFTNGLD